MKVIPPVAINEITLTSISAADPFTAAAYNGATNYGFAVFSNSNGLIYQSLRASNLNNDPATSPLWWKVVGVYEIAFNNGTTYAANDYSTYKHRVYISLQAANVGNNPFTSPLWWLDVGATNQYAMFDTSRDTATVAASPLTLTITPGQRINAIAFLGVIADSIRIVMTTSGVTVYDTTVTLVERLGIIDGYSYFFTEFSIKEDSVLFDLPAFTNCIVSITATRSSGNVEIGSCCVGNAIDIGSAQHDGASDGMLNFSTIQEDTFGNTQLIQRRSLSEPNLTVWAPAVNTDLILAVRETLNAVPAVWCGIADQDHYFFRSLCVLGVFTQFDIGFPYDSHCVLNIQLREI